MGALLKDGKCVLVLLAECRGITLHIYLFPHSPNPFLTYGQMRQKCAFRLGAINHLNALTACLISGRLTKEGVGV